MAKAADKGTAEKTDPALWEAVKAEITAGEKGGEPGEWSARKAQMAVQAYKKRGGGYRGAKTEANHLVQWEHEEWGTKSGRPSGETHERYLPKEAREALTDADYRRTTAKKRADTRKGRQFSAQPEDVTAKTAEHRGAGKATATEGGARSKTELLAEAREKAIPGRSRMSKADLARALAA